MARAKLVDMEMDAQPTTGYLLQYCEKCLARCIFCELSRGLPRIARVVWPEVELGKLLPRLPIFDRVCLQSVLKRGWIDELLEMLRELEKVGRPISVAVTPIPTSVLMELRRFCDYIGVGLDAATPRVFERVGKPFTWSTYMWFLEKCVEVFGRGKVFVHIVAGLGENPLELVDTMRKLYGMGCRIALFSYVPPRTGPKLPGVDVLTYRFLQVVRQCLEEGIDPAPLIDASSPRPRFKRAPPLSNPLRAVLTSGCPSCNRPFYNESPRGPIMNYPSLDLLERNRLVVEKELAEVNAL